MEKNKKLLRKLNSMFHAKNIYQRDVAKRIGCTPKGLMEKISLGRLRLSDVVIICDVLDVKLPDLLYELNGGKQNEEQNGLQNERTTNPGVSEDDL